MSEIRVASYAPGDFADMNSTASDGLSGLLEWSEPVIFDRLRDAYASRVSDAGIAWALARLHARVWRALISGDHVRFDNSRRELVASLATVGLTLDHLADADDQTMTELLEIVIARFRRSPRVSQGYHLALMQIASQLTPAKAA